MAYRKHSWLIDHKDLVKLVFEFFACRHTSQSEYDWLKETCLNNPVAKVYDTKHELHIQMDAFKIYDIMHYWVEKGKPYVNGINMTAFEKVLDAFVDIEFITSTFDAAFSRHRLYRFDSHYLAEMYSDNNLLYNRLFGWEYIAENYTASVYKIDNVLDGKHDIGNGFLINHLGRSKLVTNFHVIDKADRLLVKTFDEQAVEIEDTYFDKGRDLALITLREPSPYLPFRLIAEFAILDEVLTIGYPSVPQTATAFPVYHLGQINSNANTYQFEKAPIPNPLYQLAEINSHVENDYWKRPLFLFSAKSNPGTSGSPIIENNGLVVGVVTQHLDRKGEILEGRLPYYAGVPTIEVMDFLTEVEQKAS